MSLVPEPAQDEWLIMLLVSILGATAYSVVSRIHRLAESRFFGKNDYL